MALTTKAHQLIRTHFAGRNPDNLNLAVDATCGNGLDTVFLASLGFKSLIAIDIQNTAIQTTQVRISQSTETHPNTEIQYCKTGHENLADLVKEPIDCIVFNLGYLPSKNGIPVEKRLSTKQTTTLLALQSAIDRLSEDGLISCICYPGHSIGAIETKAVQRWLNQLPPKWQITEFLSNVPSPRAPFLYTIAGKTKS